VLFASLAAALLFLVTNSRDGRGAPLAPSYAPLTPPG
jgi:hypothetical protein